MQKLNFLIKYQNKTIMLKSFQTILVLLFIVFVSMAQAQTTYYVSTAGNDGNTGTEGSPFLTIGHAVDVAVSGDDILVAQGVYKINTPITIPNTKNLAITGQGTGATIRQMTGGQRVLSAGENSAAGNTVIITNVTINGGTISGGDGGGLYIHPGCSVIMNDVIVFGNQTIGNGGGVYVGGSLHMTGGEVTGNEATGEPGNGGGILVAPGAYAEISRVLIQENVTARNGGGISVEGELILIDTDIKLNSALHGGGIQYQPGSTGSLTNVNVDSNQSLNRAGGIRINALNGEVTVTWTGGSLSNNVAGNVGGGAVIQGNQTGNGVIFRMTDVNISGNTATGTGEGPQGGGGIFWGVNVQAWLQNVVIDGNAANNGPGGGFQFIANQGINDRPVNIQWIGGSLSGNTSVVDGGGVHINAPDRNLSIRRLNITGNSAAGSGDAVYRSSGTVDAQENWWGTNHEDPIPTQQAAIENQLSGVTVDAFGPWCLYEDCTGELRVIVIPDSVNVASNPPGINVSGPDGSGSHIFEINHLTGATFDPIAGGKLVVELIATPNFSIQEWDPALGEGGVIDLSPALSSGPDSYTLNGVGILSYYSQSSGLVNTLSNWNTARAGGGSQAGNFTSGASFFIQDSHEMTTDGKLEMSGIDARIIIEEGGTWDMGATEFPLGVSLTVEGTLMTQNPESIPVPPGGTYGGTVEYNAPGPQNITAASYNNLIIDGSGTKTIASDVIVTGTFSFNAGNLALNGKTFTLNGDINLAGGKFAGSSSSNLIISNSATLTGALTFDELVNNGTKVNNIQTGTDVTLGSSLDVRGNMTIDAGNFRIGPNQLRLRGALNLNAGNLVGGTESRIQVLGSGDALSLPSIDLGILIVNRSSGISLSGVTKIFSSVRLSQGTIENSSNIILAKNTRIQVYNGSFDAPPVFNNQRIDYTGNTEVTTGNELPSSPTPIWKLNLDNPAGIILNSDIVVDNSISLTNGSLNINGKSITLALPNKSVIEETAANRIYGTSGSISVNAKIRTEEINYDPWNLGLKFTVERELRNFTITRGFAPDEISGSNGILRSYELNINRKINSALNATIVFTYRDDELNGNEESSLVLYYRNSPSKPWNSYSGQVLDKDNNTITVTGLDALPKYITARGVGGDNIVINDPQQNENMERVEKEMTRDEKIPGKENTHEKRSIEENEVEVVELPEDFDMVQNYPNPFNPVTTLKFAIPESDFVTVKVFDISGREIAQLVNGTMNAGYHTVQFNGSDFASGIYFYRITTGSGFEKVMRMSLIK
jgi:hypothetical protein